MDDAYSAVLVRPQRLVFGTLLAICGGCLRRHVREWWGPCWCNLEKCPNDLQLPALAWEHDPPVVNACGAV